MATEQLIIQVDERGTRTVTRRIAGVGKAAGAAGTAVQKFQDLLLGAGALIAARQLLRLADAYTELQTRIRVVTDTQEDLISVTTDLFAISNRTFTAVEANAAVFSRLAQSTRELGVSQEDLLGITESLNQAVQIGGSSAEEARAGLIQLSQGLASGALRGDELRSVLEQLPVVADVIAKELGVTRGELRKFGEEGRITAEAVIDAFTNAREELGDRFAKVTITVSNAFQVLRNNTLRAVGELDKATGATAIFRDTILSLAENVGGVLRIAINAGLVITLTTVIRLVNALTVAIAANPLGALAVGVTAAVLALIEFADEIKVTGDGVVSLADFARATFQVLRAGFTQLRSVAGAFADGVGSALQLVFGTEQRVTIEDFFRGIALGIDALVGVAKASFAALSAVITDPFRNASEEILKIMNDLIETLNGVIRTVNQIAIRAGLVTNVARGAPREGQQLPSGSLVREIPPIRRDFTQSGKTAAQIFADTFKSESAATDLFEEFLRQARDLATALPEPDLGFFETARTAIFDFVDQSVEKLEDLGDGFTDAVDASRTELLRLNGLTEDQIKLLDELNRKEALRAQRRADLNALLAAGVGNEAVLNAELDKLNRNLDTSRTTAQAFFQTLEDGIITAEQLGQAFGGIALSGINQVSDAIGELAVSGDLESFKENLSRIFEDIAKQIVSLIVQFLILQSIKIALSGGAAAAGGGDTAGGGFDLVPRQAGGPLNANQPALVGERGPELFVPNTSGNVVPNNQIGPAAPPMVNVTVVDNPEEIPAALATTAGEEAVMAIIQRRKSDVGAIVRS